MSAQPAAPVLGFDIGGSSVKVASIASGTMDKTRTIATGRVATGDDVIAAIRTTVHNMRSGRGVGARAIGVSLPGMVRTTYGSVDLPGKLAGLEGQPIVERLRDDLGIPVWCLNDGAAAALGEARLGAGQGVQTVVALTLGTGVGSGVVVDGEVWPPGEERNGAGFGHITIELGGRTCLCGNRGCPETILGDVSVGGELLDHQRRGAPSAFLASLPADGSLGFRDLLDGVRLSDPICRAIFDRWVGALSALAVSIVHVADPGIIVIGGGMAKAAPLFLPAVEAYVKQYAWRFPRDRPVVIARAALGPSAGAAGAALFAATSIEAAL